MNFDRSGSLNLSSDDKKNVIEHEGIFYQLKRLSADFEHSKGGNSSVCIIVDPNDDTESVVKFSKFNVQEVLSAKQLRALSDGQRRSYQFHRKRNARFEQELNALEIAKNSNFLNIVAIKFSGEIVNKSDGKVFPYFVMEKADSDLKDFILQNPELDVSDRLAICIDIMKAVKELHGKTIYHRDIKPDNILLFNKSYSDIKSWKLSDLGLVHNGLREGTLDGVGERIGPYGWLSPEAMNKFLTEKTQLKFDCKIDNCSDIFQLGKVFWFVFQGNVPIGQLQLEDFRLDFSEKKFLFNTLKSMLEYSKSRRLLMSDLETDLQLLSQELFEVKTVLV